MRVPTQDVPGPGGWPCQADAMSNPPPRLVAALYEIARDYVQPGDLEQVALTVNSVADDTEFTNPHLESYARALTGYLLAGWSQRSYPYKDGEATVLGPEVIVSETEKVISWKGHHYKRVDGSTYSPAES